MPESATKRECPCKITIDKNGWIIRKQCPGTIYFYDLGPDAYWKCDHCKAEWSDGKEPESI